MKLVVIALLLVVSCSGDGLSEGDCNCEDKQGCEEECGQNTVNRRVRTNDCQSKYLPSDSCNPNDDNKVCIDKWYYEFIGEPFDHSDCDGSNDDECFWNPCCFEAQCRLPDNYSIPLDGDVVKAENVTLSWYASPHYTAQLVISWSQPQPENIGGYQLVISTTNSSNYEDFFIYIDRCICLPASTRVYSVSVGLAFNRYIQVKLASLPYDSGGLWNDQTKTASVIEKVPENCWDLAGASLDKCGILLPSAPQNVSINGTTWNSSSIILTLKWSPPEHYIPDIIAYKIYIFGPLSEISAMVNGTTLQYSTVINSSTIYEVSIFASNTQDYSSCDEAVYTCEKFESSNENDENCEWYCWGDLYIANINYPTKDNHTNTTTTTSSTTNNHPSVTNTNNHRTILAASLSATGVLVLLVLGIIVVLFGKRYLHHKKSSVYVPMMSSPSPPPTPISDGPVKVFVINCPQSSEEDLRLVRNLCHNLANHSIDPISYEYESGPGQVGIYQWTEENFVNSDMIVFVCNKSLCEAWGDSESEQDPFVSASRQLLQGHLSSSESVSKFAIALLRESDSQYIPSLYLKNISTFVLFRDGHCNEEELVRYIKQVPHFVRPQVRNGLEDIRILTEHVM
ncbi:uncharacterized protein [Dysidea avara]|uniref:uncharacterized protein isoform X2 n=1 Tax=Dysidea avara TaxID=196820 RepID=UPI0033218CAF